MKRKFFVIAMIGFAALMMTSCAKKYDCHFKGTVKSYYNWGSGYEPIKTVIKVTIEGEDFYKTDEETCENGIFNYDISGWVLKAGSYNITVDGYINILWDNGYSEYVSDRVNRTVYVTQDGSYYEDFRLYLQ